MKLALGTAQFGMPYGVTNFSGIPALTEIASILDLAKNHGITVLDSAYSYGSAESKLGNLDLSSFQVITKLPAISLECDDIYGTLLRYLEVSLNRLGQDSIYGLLLHQPSQLIKSGGIKIYEALQRFKESGLTSKLGVSIYSPDELGKICDLLELDLVQAPLNIFDQRLISSGWIDKLAASNVEIHTRSTFLQGLLLLPKGELPVAFEGWRLYFDRWHDWLEENNISAQMACLKFALSHPNINKVIVGVSNIRELEEIIVASSDGSAYFDNNSIAGMACIDEMLINPSKWN